LAISRSYITPPPPRVRLPSLRPLTIKRRRRRRQPAEPARRPVLHLRRRVPRRRRHLLRVGRHVLGGGCRVRLQLRVPLLLVAVQAGGVRRRRCPRTATPASFAATARVRVFVGWPAGESLCRFTDNVIITLDTRGLMVRKWSTVPISLSYITLDTRLRNLMVRKWSTVPISLSYITLDTPQRHRTVSDNTVI
jgi:hypothetical protein